MFLIVFLWQFPHFLAIAWIYRDDYQRAGFRMLTVGDTRGRMTGCQAVSYALALIPAGLLPAMVGPGWPDLFRRGRCSWAYCTWWRPLDSGSKPAIAAHAVCSVRRLFTCPRYWFCSC